MNETKIRVPEEQRTVMDALESVINEGDLDRLKLLTPGQMKITREMFPLKEKIFAKRQVKA